MFINAADEETPRRLRQALQPETIARRFAEAYDYEERGEEHE